MRAKLREVADATLPPKEALLRSLGGRQEGFEVLHNKVLVATYIAPPKMLKGPKGEDIPFLRTDRNVDEDRFQGKAFLVIKVGPLAFVDDGIAKFGGKTIKEGDWVMARPNDGPELYITDVGAKAGTACRIFSDVNIIARINDPALIY